MSVTAVNPGPMVEGKEYLLNCDIINVAPLEKLRVNWYRGNKTVFTQMFDSNSVTPVSVNSTLRVTPERDYNKALFGCEAELHLGPEGPGFVPAATSSLFLAAVLCEFSTYLYIIVFLL